MTQQDQSGRRSGAKKYRRTAVSTVRRRTVAWPAVRPDGLQQSQKLLERRVVVVAPPIGDIADAGRSVAIANFAEDNTGKMLPVEDSHVSVMPRLPSTTLRMSSRWALIGLMSGRSPGDVSLLISTS